MKKIFCDIQNKKVKLHSNNKNLAYFYSHQTQQVYKQKQVPHLHIIKLDLKVKNSQNEQIIFNQSFPYIQMKFKEQCIYLFPQQPIRYSAQPASFTANYGGRMHFPFISFRNKSTSQCLMFLSGDEKGRFKQIRMSKKQNGEIAINFKFYDIFLKPSEQYKFPPVYVIMFQSLNLLKDSIIIYKHLSKNWINYEKNIRKKDLFHQSFILRVIELYEIQWHQSQRRIKKFKGINLLQLIKQDEERLGPIKFVHLRDWSAQDQSLKGKFGNYLKQNMVGPLISKQWLKQQINQIKSQNIGVGLYLEGYLVSKSLFQQISNQKNIQNQDIKKFQMLDKQIKPYQIWGSNNYTMCNNDKQWRSILTKSILNATDYLGNDSVYIDQFGFGSRTSPYKVCINEDHSHSLDNFDLQVGQLETLCQIKANKGANNVGIYIEQTPNDVTINRIEGSLSSSAKLASENLLPICLTRFVFPHHKIYQLITEYNMVQNEYLSNGKIKEQNVQTLIKSICVAFWNGNGIYVPKNIAYYDKKVIQTIKNCNQNYIKYNQYFLEGHPEPLCIGNIQSDSQLIFGNKFMLEKENYITTIINLNKDSGDKNIFKYQCQCAQQIYLEPHSIGVFYKNSYSLVSKF